MKNTSNTISRETSEMWEAIWLMHARIRNGEYPNCTEVAEDVGVSRRTMQRYVEYMAERLKLPLHYDPLKYGYTYTGTTPEFLTMPATQKDMHALLMIHKVIQEHASKESHKPLKLILEKMTHHVDPKWRHWLKTMDARVSVRSFAPEETDFKLFELIAMAMAQGRELKFRYRNWNAVEEVERHVRPYHLVNADNRWYLLAYDLKREAIRTFAFCRMKETAMAPGKFKFPKSFDADKHLDECFLIWRGEEEHDVVLEFDSWATDAVRGRRWHRSQEFIDLPNRGCHLKLHLTTLEEVDRWILSWGKHVRVVESQELAKRVKYMAKEVVDLYPDL